MYKSVLKGKNDVTMERLNLHKNTEQTILLFRNLDKEQKYNFFKQIEKEIDSYYYEYGNSKKKEKIRMMPFTKAEFLEDIREAKTQIAQGDFNTIEEFEKEAELWK